MRINVTGEAPTGGDELAPLDPPPPLDIDDLFDLDFLRVSENNVQPFSEVEIGWSITARDGVSFADFVFTLTAGGGNEVSTDLAASGRTQFSAYQSTVLRIVGRRQGSGDSSTLGESLVLRVDESDCETLPIPRLFMDAEVIARIAEITGSTAELRLRRTTVPGPAGFHEVERDVEPTWEVGVIRYYFPLEVVIPNFFNADLDVRIEIRFQVHHSGENTDLEVAITHSSDVDFDTVENILSLGHASTAATTANRLIPLILACETRELERDILRQILQYIGARLDNARLLAVRVVPSDDEGDHVAIVLCAVHPEPN